MHLNKILKLIGWIMFFESIGFLLGLLTQANIYPWYEQLNKSSLTPPGFIFSIVWSLLYALLAVIASRLSSYNNKTSSRKVVRLFALQMLMNWTWTPLFFQLHWLRVSALWLIVLTCLNGALFLMAPKIDKTSAWLLSPYVIWLVFASYLNIVIALMN